MQCNAKLKITPNMTRVMQLSGRAGGVSLLIGRTGAMDP